MNREKLETLKRQIDELINPDGYELIELEWVSAKDRHLKLYIDFFDQPNKSQEVIKIDDCVLVNKTLEGQDFLEAIPGSYQLEVCSPGLERPIRYLKDFTRWVGHPTKIQLRESQNQKRKVEGVIIQVDHATQEVIVANTDDKSETAQNKDQISIPLNNIQKANLIYEWS